MIQDIEDNYPSYLEDEAGYAYDAWDVLSQDEIHRHDALLHASLDALSGIDLAGLTDFERWAYGRAMRRHGDAAAFLEAARLILSSSQPHRGLTYDEVFAVTIDALAQAQLFDEARLHLATYRERWPEHVEGLTLEAWVEFRQDAQRGLELLERLYESHPDDAELQLDVAEDLRAFGREDEAQIWLRRARETALRTGYDAILVDLALFDEETT